MHVLVTGGAGFIGSHIVEKLLERGDQVTVIDNFSTGRRTNLPESLDGSLTTLTHSTTLSYTGHLPPTEDLYVIQGDIADPNLQLWQAPDVVVHCAASYSDPNNHERDTSTNILGAINLTRFCNQIKPTRIIYFQTALRYGLNPRQKNSAGQVEIDCPLDPGSSSYAISKVAAEQYLRMGTTPVYTMVLANAYGPRNLSGPVPTFYQRLKNNQPIFISDSRRDFIYVDAIVDATVSLIDGAGKQDTYHISTGSDHTINTVAHHIRDYLDPSIILPPVSPRTADDAPSLLLDPTATETDLGWTGARCGLYAGVASACDWYRDNPFDHTYTHLRIK